MLNKKHNLKSGKKDNDKEKGFERKNKTGNHKKREKIDEEQIAIINRNLKCSMLFFSENKIKQERKMKKRQKQETKRKQKRKTRRKKERQEQERETEKEKQKKGEVKKGWGRKKEKHRK